MSFTFKKDINFMGKRKVFFAISICLIVASIASIAIRGLSFGIEFVGGTSVVFNDANDIGQAEIEQAFADEGIEGAIVQSTTDSSGKGGYIVRLPITEAEEATTFANTVTEKLELNPDTVETTTIGPGWGAEVTRTSAIAFIVAIMLIIAYIAIRFEFKMGVTAIITLIHDIVIVVGVYALLGRELTPNVIAALLTIMGYSLYDTVVVFHRINDNAATANNHSFLTVANHSVNQVLMRSINTTLSSMIPVLAMLIFGTGTLHEFAFAMAIGLALGAASSIGLATPLYALWKQREPKYKKLFEKFGDGVGHFSASENLGS